MAGLLAAFVVFAIINDATMSPEKKRAYDLKARADQFCKQAMDDSAPGPERRQTRAICDRLQAEADRKIREAP